ncbi:hypothetical protein [Salinispora arenicola]|uniref:Uncharacterized protein n=1 Tax=Salinispora arenicola TaxID=168697 RepID=A0A542XM72_SALAC|nr:hypothetical protein [Salinispora arenicola]TQL36955.1 hypothetical protein FB564_2096 [Salinispora arenicola]
MTHEYLTSLIRHHRPRRRWRPTRVAGLANVIVLDADSSTTLTADVVA